MKLYPYLIFVCLFLLCNCSPTYDRQEERADAPACGNSSENNSVKIWSERKLTIAGNMNNGKELFTQNCSMCHTVTNKKLTAPGLSGIYDRTPRPVEEYLINFISNSQEVIKSGDPYANKIFGENGTVMPRYDTSLTKQEIKDIVVYITGF